jgi:type I restriction enzyme S subunit
MSYIDQVTGLNSSFELKPYEEIKKGYTKFEKNSVLVAKITPCTENNKTAIMNKINGGFATTEIYPIQALEENLNPEYLLFYLRSPEVREILTSNMIGATGRQRVPSETIKKLSLPVPPLNIQKNIAEYVKNLYFKVENNKSELKKKLNHFKALKSSILNSAFKGEL